MIMQNLRGGGDKKDYYGIFLAERVYSFVARAARRLREDRKRTAIYALVINLSIGLVSVVA